MCMPSSYDNWKTSPPDEPNIPTWVFDLLEELERKCKRHHVELEEWDDWRYEIEVRVHHPAKRYSISATGRDIDELWKDLVEYWG